MSDFERPIIAKIYQLLDEVNEYVHPKFFDYLETAERYGYENKVKIERHLERTGSVYINKYANLVYNNKSTAEITILKNDKATRDINPEWLVALSSHRVYKCKFSKSVYAFNEKYHFNDIVQVYNFLKSINLKQLIADLSCITFECKPDNDGYPAYPVKFDPGIDTAILKLKNDLRLAEGMAYV